MAITKPLYMLQVIFDFRLNFIFLCFRIMVHVMSLEQKKMKFNLKSNLTCKICTYENSLIEVWSC